MKPDQQRYCMNRARVIFDEKTSLLRDRFTTKETVPNDKAKMRQIRDGDAYVKSVGWSLKSPIGECFNFCEVGAESLDKEAFSKACRELRKKYSALTDQIMLSNGANAMKLLQDFEKP